MQRVNASQIPVVVQYLYVHEQGEAFSYPTVRSGSSLASVAVRYLECVLTQSASLQLQAARCDLVLVTNVSDRTVLGRRGAELMSSIEALGVQVLLAGYSHRPTEGTETYVSSRYVFDAILAATAGQPDERRLWLTDVDCVWADPPRVFAGAPLSDEIGCIHIVYPPDWDAVGFGADGRTRNAIGEIAAGLGSRSAQTPAWVGGELLTGTAKALRELVGVCEELDLVLANQEKTLPNEEQILTLAGATGQVSFRDLSSIAWRMPTGPRNQAPSLQDPLSIGLWHLPSEKGLSLRRAAREVSSGRVDRLRSDLSNPERAARRFNIRGTGFPRRIRDDSWLLAQRLAHPGRSSFRTRKWGF